MIPNPIHKVLSTLSTHGVRYLLMGGQACVFYGAAEFSRDCDIVIHCDPANLGRLQAALDELQAHRIAVPPFAAEYLLRGHAVHFRCHSPEVANMRLDVMAKLRNVDPFDELWPRRTTITDEIGTAIELMSLPDLIAAKKTQRDKDWPMIRRLVEAHYAQHKHQPSDRNIRFWLTESLTPETLVDLSTRYPGPANEIAHRQVALEAARSANMEMLRSALSQEQEIVRDADRSYWEPLKRELERLRAERQ
ncbi:MAG: hypothetical protein L0Z07_07595 [Planctomycetes bacterium]|nr:hypothetical protein [Planctomycetota bacterium]